LSEKLLAYDVFKLKHDFAIQIHKRFDVTPYLVEVADLLLVISG
jgi:hypothetical protein